MVAAAPPLRLLSTDRRACGVPVSQSGSDRRSVRPAAASRRESVHTMRATPRRTIPLIVLGGSDRRPTTLPPQGSGFHPLSGCKGLDVRLGGRCLIEHLVDRLRVDRRLRSHLGGGTGRSLPAARAIDRRHRHRPRLRRQHPSVARDRDARLPRSRGGLRHLRHPSRSRRPRHAAARLLGRRTDRPLVPAHPHRERGARRVGLEAALPAGPGSRRAGRRGAARPRRHHRPGGAQPLDALPSLRPRLPDAQPSDPLSPLVHAAPRAVDPATPGPDPGAVAAFADRDLGQRARRSARRRRIAQRRAAWSPSSRTTCAACSLCGRTVCVIRNAAFAFRSCVHYRSPATSTPSKKRGPWEQPSLEGGAADTGVAPAGVR